MKYHFYKDYKNVPMYIEKQIKNNIYPTNNPLLFFKDDLIDGIQTNNYVMMFVTNNKELVGLLGIVYMPLHIKKLMNLHFSEKTFEIRNVFILPTFRGKGICKKMLIKINEYVIKNNIARRLKLDVYDNNIPAIKCYKSVGFHLYKNQKAQKWLNDNFKRIYGVRPKSKVLLYTIKI